MITIVSTLNEMRALQKSELSLVRLRDYADFSLYGGALPDNLEKTAATEQQASMRKDLHRWPTMGTVFILLSDGLVTERAVLNERLFT
jgi:hypothetical protein